MVLFIINNNKLYINNKYIELKKVEVVNGYLLMEDGTKYKVEDCTIRNINQDFSIYKYYSYYRNEIKYLESLITKYNKLYEDYRALFAKRENPRIPYMLKGIIDVLNEYNLKISDL